jgi:hypothetical protein
MDKNTGLSAKKDLTLADFAAGQHVKVTYRATDGTVTEIRLIPTGVKA